MHSMSAPHVLVSAPSPRPPVPSTGTGGGKGKRHGRLGSLDSRLDSLLVAPRLLDKLRCRLSPLRLFDKLRWRLSMLGYLLTLRRLALLNSCFTTL